FVIDGDDIKWDGQNFRLEGYDSPEVRNLRSKFDRNLERQRGLMAKGALHWHLAQARSAHMLVNPQKDRFGRSLGVLLINGRDVSQIAIQEGWGVPFAHRQRTDWGDPRRAFPNLPVPQDYEVQKQLSVPA